MQGGQRRAPLAGHGCKETREELPWWGMDARRPEKSSEPTMVDAVTAIASKHNPERTKSGRTKQFRPKGAGPPGHSADPTPQPTQNVKTVRPRDSACDS
eukprot:355383-Chlamydomonas_euryale.AAC.4